MVPGLIDAHTSSLGWRSQPRGWLATGRSVLRTNCIHAEVVSRYTVEQTRAASDDALMERGMVRLREALRTGTTHMEAKSGYGLDTPQNFVYLISAIALE